MSEAKVKRRTQAERRGEAETRLVQAAIKLVAERGYDGFTLADVGEAAGYSRGLPAHYFGRKEDLLGLAAQHVVDIYVSDIAKLPLSSEGLPRIFALIRRYVAVGDGRGPRALGMLIAMAMVKPTLRRSINLLNAQGLERLELELRAGMARGNVRPDVNVPNQAKLIYAFLRGQMVFATLDPKFDGVAVGEAFIADLEVSLSPQGGKT